MRDRLNSADLNTKTTAVVAHNVFGLPTPIINLPRSVRLWNDVRSTFLGWEVIKELIRDFYYFALL